MADNKLYTWVDVQDGIVSYFKSNEQEMLSNINFRVYWDGLCITFSSPIKIEDIDKLLESILLSRFEKIEADNRSVILEGGRRLPIVIEEVEIADIDKLHFKPTINRPPFIGSSEINDFKARSPLASPIIYAFHSFKGGVGRTLHAISMALNLVEDKKVLLIDADFEAPGISWLVNTPVSFADLLALIHSDPNHAESIKIVAESLKSDSKEGDNLFILPAFRSLSLSAPNLEIKPEHIYRFNDNPFILTDVLVELAKELNVDYVLIDLRAGVSELSTGWFFDPRINKVFVTTLSSQSILGTSMMFRLLSKFEAINHLRNVDAPIPSLIVSQVPKSSLFHFLCIFVWPRPPASQLCNI